MRTLLKYQAALQKLITYIENDKHLLPSGRIKTHHQIAEEISEGLDVVITSAKISYWLRKLYPELTELFRKNMGNWSPYGEPSGLSKLSRRAVGSSEQKTFREKRAEWESKRSKARAQASTKSKGWFNKEMKDTVQQLIDAIRTDDQKEKQERVVKVKKRISLRDQFLLQMGAITENEVDEYEQQTY